MTYLCHFDALDELAKAGSVTNKQLADAIGLKNTSDFSKAKRGQLNEAHVRKLEVLVKADRTSFAIPVGDHLTKEAFGDKDIRRVYEELTRKNKASTGERHFVAVISGDGFLELQDQAFFNDLCRYVSDGMEVKYYYSDSEHEASMRNFQELYRRFEARFAHDKQALERIAGFKISREPSLFFGWGARYVMFCRRDLTNENTSVIHGLTYIESSTWDEAKQKQVGDSRLWVRMKDQDAHRYMVRLVEYAEPIKNLGCFFQNHFDRRLRNDYRRAFGRIDNCTVYREIVRALGSGNIVGSALQNISNVLTTRQKREFEFLDIGFGDGDVTAAAIQQLKQIGVERIRTTLVDSAGAPHAQRHSNIQSVPTFDEPFEDWQCEPNRFDLIVASHALYLIDPSYLDKLYDLLRPEGIAVFVHAPKENNFINFVTDFLDSSPVERSNPTSPTTRVSRRLFAEELESQLRARFGQAGLELEKHPGTDSLLPRQQVLNPNQRLTEFGKKMLELFSCRQLGNQEFNEVTTAIRSKYGDDGDFQNENWVFTLDKKKIRELNTPRIYGALTTIR